MHRPIRTALVTAAVAAVAAVPVAALSACGTSDSTAQAQTVTTAQTGAQTGARPGDPSAMITQALDPLVTAGTITAAQETAVIDALSSAMSADAPSGGSQTPPALPSGSQPTPGATPQAGATPPSGGAPPAGTPQGGPSAMFSTTLDGLVSDGTITGAQETAILDALSAAGPGAPSGAQPGATTQSGTATRSSSSSATQTY